MEARTSITHPLIINEVEVPAGSGRIGMTLCPGRRDSLSVVAPWARDIDADLQKIRQWGAAIVISLVEEHEFADLGVPQFGDRMRAFSQAENIVWLQLPIRDAGVPDAGFEKAWLEAGLTVRTALLAGRNVLVHCRAGLGRTGTLAARLLVEFGVPAADAIASVRRVRPGTIETSAQYRHVRGLEALDDAR